jgi:hypothetical protein
MDDLLLARSHLKNSQHRLILTVSYDMPFTVPPAALSWEGASCANASVERGTALSKLVSKEYFVLTLSEMSFLNCSTILSRRAITALTSSLILAKAFATCFGSWGNSTPPPVW